MYWLRADLALSSVGLCLVRPVRTDVQARGSDHVELAAQLFPSDGEGEGEEDGSGTGAEEEGEEAAINEEEIAEAGGSSEEDESDGDESDTSGSDPDDSDVPELMDELEDLLVDLADNDNTGYLTGTRLQERLLAEKKLKVDDQVQPDGEHNDPAPQPPLPSASQSRSASQVRPSL